MADRRVTVKLEADVKQYQAALARAAASTEALDEKVDQSAQRLNNARRSEAEAAERVRARTVQLNKVRKSSTSTAQDARFAERALARARSNLADKTYDVEAATVKLNQAEKERADNPGRIAAAQEQLRQAEADLAKQRRADAEQEAEKRGNAEAKAQAKAFKSESQRQMKSTDPHFDAAGEHSANTFGKAFQREFRQRKVFFGAVVGGALTAGAPLALAGAALLFGGIAALAGAQAEEVRTAWADLGKEIRDGAVEDAAVMIPELVDLSNQLGQAFQELRPDLEHAFAATAPLVEIFGDSVERLAKSLMPGFIDVLESGEPVMEGFATFLERTGDGLSNMLSRMAEHAPAAGDAFEDWGNVFAELLPLIGELLGRGAELANIVLPPLAAILGVVTDVVEALGPLLPAVSGGFLALRTAKLATGWLEGLSGGLARVSQGMAESTYQTDGWARGAATRVSSGATRMARGLTIATRAWDGLGKALPVAGAAAALIAASMSDATNEEERWTAALLEGGGAARRAQEDYKGLKENPLGPGWLQAIDEATGFQASMGDASAEVDKYLKTLSPLERAQVLATQATNNLKDAASRYAADSPQVQQATADYTRTQADLRVEEDKVKASIEGVTQAMLDQAERAMAGIDAQFNYRNSLNDLEDAVLEVDEATKNLTNKDENLRTSQEDVTRAQDAAEEQAYNTAKAYGEYMAQTSGADKDSAEFAETMDKQTLVALKEMRKSAGPGMRAALDIMIASLEDAGVKVDETGADARGAAGDMDDLGASIEGLPDGKEIAIKVRTAGRFIINPNGGLQEFASPNGDGPGAQVRPRGGTGDGPGGTIGNGRTIPVNVLYDSAELTTAIDEFADAIANAGPPAPAAGGGSGMGWQAQWRVLQAAFGNRVNLHSAFRPGSITATGNLSYHASGRAVDVTPSMEIFNYLARNFPNSRELIYSPAGTRQIWNGAPHWYNEPTRGDHWDHVHWAMANGGVINEPVIGRGLRSGQSYAFGERGPELVLPTLREFAGGLGGLGGGGGTTILKVFLDGQEWRGIARVEAEGVVDGTLVAGNRILSAAGVR